MTTGTNTSMVSRLATLGLVEWEAPLALDTADVDALLMTRPHEGVVCLLGAAVERGLVEVGPSDAERITMAWAELMASAVQLDMLLVEVTQALTVAGIESRVLKGVANAMLDELEPTWRSYGDVDVLVPSDRLLPAADALARMGLQPVAAPVGRRWARSNTKSLTLQHASGMQVDVHRMLAAGPFGARIRAGSLFEGGDTLSVGAVHLTALTQADRFLHSCYHAALGGVRGARHRRDVLLLSRSVQPSAVESRFAEGWSSSVVAAALSWADEGVEALGADWAGWLAARSADPADDALLAAYGGSFRDIARAELRTTSGWFAKAQYAAALVWPSRSNLAARGVTRRQHLRRLVSSR